MQLLANDILAAIPELGSGNHHPGVFIALHTVFSALSSPSVNARAGRKALTSRVYNGYWRSGGFDVQWFPWWQSDDCAY